MKCAPTVAALVAAYLALAGAVLLAWLAWPGQALPAYAIALCAAPVLLQLLIAAGARRDAKQLVLRSFAWALFAPILLLMWGASSDLALPVAPRQERAPDELELQALAVGAASVERVPAASPEAPEMGR